MILVTGVTGFLGGATVAELLRDVPVSSLRFLVRAQQAEMALQRLLASLRRFEVPAAILDALSSDQIILGDLGDVAAFSDDPRLDDVTHVLNCAAVTSFGDHPGIWPVNVDGTLAFAARMARVEGLQRFLHVGTAMSCGQGKPSPIEESWEFASRDAHLVEYTASKAEAERRMRELPSLPLVVARPSVVVGHTRLGCAPSTSIFWVFRMVQDLGCFLLSADDCIDVVPVDYCASALRTLLLKSRLTYDLYHIAAGDSSSETFRAIDCAMAQARGIDPVADSYRQIKADDVAELLPRFQERLGIRNRRLLSAATKLYGEFSLLGYRFTNLRLLQEGMPSPPAFTSYIDRCIRSTEGMPLLEQMMDDFK